MPTLTRFTSPKDFATRAEAYLLEREAQHNLILGLTASLQHNLNLYGSQPYFAVVEEQTQVVAAALMTPPYQLALAWTENLAALKLIAQDVYAFRPGTPRLVAPVPVGLHFAEIWRDLTGRPFHKNMAERIYRLDTVKPPSGVAGHMRRIAEADRDLLLAWIRDFQLEAFGEVDEAVLTRNVHNMLTLPPEYRGTFLWEDEQPVSLVSYGGPTPHSMRIGPVYTPQAFRGRGYASACTAAVSQYLLDSGRQFVTLFTNLANPTSNKIYQQIGYKAVGDVDDYKFD